MYRFPALGPLIYGTSNIVVEDFPDNKKNIFSAGIIITRKSKKTKSGANMLLCTLEDEDGMYESAFFPGVYKKNLKTVSSQSAVIIEGRICSKDSHIFIIGKNTVSLADLKKINSMTRKDSIKNNLLAKAGSVWEIQEG